MMHSHSRYLELNKRKKEEKEGGGGGGTEFLWVTSIWFLLSPVTLTRPCKRILEEEKSKHVGLAQQNGFGPAFLQGHILSTRVEVMKSMVQWESCDT
jgi:hypothetical protein